MSLIPFFVAIAAVALTAGAKEDLYIGTYSSSGPSKGIYYASLDVATGKLSEASLAAAAPDPSYVAVRSGGKFAYAVDESTDAVSSFSIQPDHTLKLINTVHGIGAGPCHVAVAPNGKTVFTAGYGGGTIASLPVHPDGSLGPVATLITDHGSGPNKSRQEAAHMHVALPDAKGRFVYSCDLGTDEIAVYTLDRKTGKIVRDDAASTKAPAGGGPRHLAFSKDGKTLFANNEMGCSVTSYAVDPANGGLKPGQTISSLPDEASMKGNTTAEIVLHPNGKWLYLSNRGHDSIACYAVSPSGELSLTEIKKLNVKVPRGFDVDPSGRWLVVAGQSTNTIAVYAIDPANGALSPNGAPITCGTPVSVAFVR
jgi:6-phosphogluconolactonase